MEANIYWCMHSTLKCSFLFGSMEPFFFSTTFFLVYAFVFLRVMPRNTVGRRVFFLAAM